MFEKYGFHQSQSSKVFMGNVAQHAPSSEMRDTNEKDKHRYSVNGFYKTSRLFQSIPDFK